MMLLGVFSAIAGDVAGFMLPKTGTAALLLAGFAVFDVYVTIAYFRRLAFAPRLVITLFAVLILLDLAYVGPADAIGYSFGAGLWTAADSSTSCGPSPRCGRNCCMPVDLVLTRPQQC
jgi:hypothetical protein